MASRGLRNNNPGNIRKSKDDWLGLADLQPDPSFFTFVSDYYGIRALAKILLNYQRKRHLMSVSEMISRWAPSNENDTQAYIAAVSARMKVSPLERVDLTIDVARFVLMVKAIIQHENGTQPFTDQEIISAVEAVL